MPLLLAILSSILDAIFPPRDTQLLVRNAGAHALVDLLQPRVVALGNDEACTALLSYSDSLVRATVVEAKFHGSKRAARLLAAPLQVYLNDQASTNITLIPVPLSQARKRDRGYNQVERVLRAACESASLSSAISTSLLARPRTTTPQTTLSAQERRENLQDAFMCRIVCDPAHTYIVIDDVVTTGATLSAAITALKAAGAVQVTALALAHQPRNGTV